MKGEDDEDRPGQPDDSELTEYELDRKYGRLNPPPPDPPSERALQRKYERLRRENNPAGRPTGDCTGRCWRCGSRNLWTDNLAYGCHDCGMIRCGE